MGVCRKLRRTRQVVGTARMTRNPIARDLRTPKYRQRVINGRKKEMSRHNGLPGYDAWKTASPYDEPGYGDEDDHGSECDCCGKMKFGCVDVYFPPVGDIHACPECRGEEDK